MKVWAAHISRHVERWTELCRQRNIEWWPRFAYHFTDVRNAAPILEDEELLSRELAVLTSRMINDNAATALIDETPEEHRRFARLYFRPRTPTQFRNEGIRAADQRWQGAHCPVPVFFCFDLAALLTRTEVQFSNGSMARPEVRYGDTLELFEAIPFQLVYHDRAITGHEDKAQIVFHRHAEILVPDRLGLEDLLAVACRTDAERRTLLYGLSATARTKWESRVRVVGDRLFFRKWPHLDAVYCVDDVLHLRFAALSSVPSVPVRLQASELGTTRTWTWSGEHTGNSELLLRLSVPARTAVEVEIQIHDCVAFRDLVVVGEEQPF